MDYYRLLRATEELIVEAALWLLLAPKTFARVLASPGWVRSYVAGENARETERRYDAYVSPPLLLAFSIVLPATVGYRRLGNAYQAGGDDVPEFVSRVFASPDTATLFFVAAAIVCRLGFSWIAAAATNTALTHQALRRLLETQCYYCAPPAAIVLAVAGGNPLATQVATTGVLVWFCYAQWCFFRAETAASPVRAIAYIAAGFGAWTALNMFWGLVILALGA